jgi:hypothetical protein
VNQLATCNVDPDGVSFSDHYKILAKAFARKG